MKRKLVVIGGGEMLGEIRRLAGPTVTVMGPQPFDILKHHYSRCRALIFTGEEDFGIVPVEAMASGRPVVAFGRGGVADSVFPGISGVFFGEQTIDAISSAIAQFERLEFVPEKIAATVRQFGREHFFRKMRTHIDGLLANSKRGHGDRAVLPLTAV
jgi:glycosyltransferase involved in cell wall biosynthesis